MRDPSDITFCITHYLRLRNLSKCIQSIHHYFPNAMVEVQETYGNLSWGRNQLAARVQTPYYFMLEEDMALTDDVNIDEMKAILESDQNLAGVSGGMVERAFKKRYCAATFEWKNNRWYLGSSEELVQKPFDHVVCDCVFNWGIFRTDVLRKVKWEEQLELSEHYEFYIRLSQRWQHKVACSRSTIRHTVARPTGPYREERGRVRQFRQLESQLLGGRLRGRYSRDVFKEGISEHR